MQDDSVATFDHPDEADTINDPADARWAVAVGAYAVRPVWSGFDNLTHNICDFAPCKNAVLQEGDIAAFSSVGPTADGRQKPDISAPGVAIVSSLSADVRICPGSEGGSTCLGRKFVTQDGKNAVEAGTSMSTPHVTGVVALMLQANPYLDPATVIATLRATARHDSFTGSAAWSPAWGAGKVDAYAAVRSIQGNQPPPTAPPPTATPTPVIPLSFNISALRAERGTNHHVSRVKKGQKITFALYLRVSSVPDDAHVTIEWRVSTQGDVIGYHTDSLALRHGDVGTFRSPWIFTPKVTGKYSVLGKVSGNGEAQQRAISFTVTRR
jgi:hypothetical protein